jgi:hypothetical protein
VNPDQYEIIITSYGEFIAAPTKSTRSLRYGYIRLADADERIRLKAYVEAIDPYLPITKVKSFDWDATKDIWHEEAE